MGSSKAFSPSFKPRQIGNGVNVLRIAPFVACQFYFYELFKLVLFQDHPQNSYTMKLVCGGLSGTVTCVLVTLFQAKSAD